MNPTFQQRLTAAKAALSAGNPKEAKHFFLKALLLNRDSAEVHDGLARCYYFLEDLDSAAYHFQEATRLDPRRSAAYINLGAVLNALDERRGALAALMEGLRLAPECAEGHYNLGLIYRREGMLEEAIAAYRQALGIAPDMADAHLNLANLFRECKKYEEAISHYRKTLELRPTWRHCVKSLENTELALAARTTSPREPQPLDPEKRVDPAHHDLETLHNCILQTQAHMTTYVQWLEGNVQPALGDLSHALIGCEESTDLDRSVQQFDYAVYYFQRAYEQLQHWIEQSHGSGHKLLHTSVPRTAETGTAFEPP